MDMMWKTYGKRARDDNKFVENINDVIICLICCIVEHRLHVIRGKDGFAKFDYRARGNTLYNIRDSQALR